MSKLDILTVGTTNGIGKYLHKELGGRELTRATSAKEIEKLKTDGVDIIIHCARNRSKIVTNENLNDYIEDNVFLTKKVLQIPHKKFIYFSTVEVYPKNDELHRENEKIDINSLKTIYGITKLMSEAIVLKKSKNVLSIRAAALLGKGMRKNSFLEIYENKNCSLSLSPQSAFNYVLYSDILELIKYAIKYDLKGIYNAAGSSNILLSDITAILGAEPNFGSYVYKIGNMDNTKIAEIIPHFRRSSRENVDLFLKELE